MLSITLNDGSMAVLFLRRNNPFLAIYKEGPEGKILPIKAGLVKDVLDGFEDEDLPQFEGMPLNISPPEVIAKAFLMF